MATPILVCVVLCTVLLSVRCEIPTLAKQSPQALVDAWMTLYPAGAVAAAVLSPEDVEYYFAGEVSPTNRGLPDEHTLFEIGSITKGFTGLLLADQVLQGKVSLNDPISKFLTDWPGRFTSPARNITLLELATHSSGLPLFPANVDPPIEDNPFVNYTSAKLYKWLDNVELVNRGTYLYSNAGAGIVGHVLEVHGSKKYENFLKERILTPLGLQDTSITLNNEQKSRLASGHGAQGEIVGNWDFDVLASAGALRSSVAELVHFVRLVAGLDETQNAIQDIFEFATRARRNTTFDLIKIGLFWHRTTLLAEDNVVIWHNGGTGGYTTYVGWVPDRQIGVVVLASNPTGVDALAAALLKLKLGS